MAFHRTVGWAACAAGLALAALAACGRSAEIAYVCPLHGSDASCSVLDKAADDVADDFAGATDGDADVLDEIGACSASIARARLDAGCVKSRCEDACALHPCDVLDAAGNPGASATCPARCGSLGLSGSVLDDVVVRAAEKPGFCTCTVCDADSQALCDEVWDCTAELQDK